MITRVFSILLILLFFLQSAIAQDQSNDGTLADSSDHNTRSYSGTDEILTGYTFQKVRQITGSVSFVYNNKLQAIPAGNIINQLQGFLPGLTIIGSGQPGEVSKNFIRGISGFSASTPLYIVDGIPLNDLSLLNPNDVESVSVLKDASTAATYGGRSLNGVIVIRTRKAKNGLKVYYDTKMGFQFPGKGTKDDLLGTQEMVNLQKLALKNDNLPLIHPLYGQLNNPVLPSWAANTDWYNEITDRSFIQNHDLAVSSGNERASIYLGGGYFDQKGIILNTNTKRYSVRVNSELKLLKSRLKIGQTMSLAKRSGSYVPNMNELSPILAGPYRSLSIIPVYISMPLNGPNHSFQPGEFGGTGMSPFLGNAINVVAERTRNKDDLRTVHQIVGSVYAEIEILSDLKWKIMAGGSRLKTESVDYSRPSYENAENILASYQREQNSDLGTWILSTYLNFDKTAGDHSMNAISGLERINTGEGDLEFLNKSGEGSQVVINQSSAKYNGIIYTSLFAKADYSFKEKYLANAIIRFDGNQVFPALGLGLRMINKSSMNNQGWLNELKLRASYGKTGNLDRDWEYAITTNIGFDAKLLNNKLGLSFDWFLKNSEHLYVVAVLPVVPGTSPGIGNYPPHTNDGDMKNTGFESSICYNKSFGDLHLYAVMNLASYRNTIGKGLKNYFTSGSTRNGDAIRNQSGYSISSFYGHKVLGLFRDQNEVTSSPVQYGAETGVFRYANLNGDNTINADDRTFLGNPHPELTAGFDVGLSYKRFDISALMYLSQGNEIYNTTKWWTDFLPSFNGQKSKRLLYDSWSENNRNATVPKAIGRSNFSTNAANNSYYLENGSYLRMKSLQIGYTPDANIIKRIKINSLRVFLQAINLFTITKYSGLDPEIGGDDYAFGIDYGNYPNVRQVLIGINLEI